MIHLVKLPPLTHQRLTQVVVLQMRLLFFAASVSTLDKNNQDECAAYLDRSPKFRGRGAQIVAWLWKAPETRLKPLKTFAEDPAPKIDKQKWVMQLAREAFSLLRKSTGALEPLGDKPEPWKQAATDFLIMFYEKVLREKKKLPKSKPGFPKCIFSDTNSSEFGAQEFLKEFQKFQKENRDGENWSLEICPACDESQYYTAPVQDETKTDIDHYLPKSKYPHLACHPFNLVPTCPLCNQRVKKGKDPLLRSSGTRRRLEDICLPYHDGVAFSEQIYLKVELTASSSSAVVMNLEPIVSNTLGEKIETFSDIYEIPKRWSNRVKPLDKEIFQDLRSFLGSHEISFDKPQALLDWLDYHLQKICDDQGQKSHSFAMVWWLSALINEAEQAFQDSSISPLKNSALLRELKSLCMGGQYVRESLRLSDPFVRAKIDKARNLRQKVRQQTAAGVLTADVSE